MKTMKINKNDDLLEKYDTIWDKVSADTKKFDSELVYNKKNSENQYKISWGWSFRFLW